MSEQVQQGGEKTAERSDKPRSPRGLGRHYQRGQTWWVQYYCRGRLIRESSGSERESVAIKLLKRRLGEMGQGRLVGPDVEKTTFEELAQMLFEDYRLNGRKSLDSAERSVAHLKSFFARTRAVEITTDRISAYVALRMKVAKPATIMLELAALKRMFALGLRAGRVGHKPFFPTIEVRNTRSGFFEDADLEAVLAELPRDLRPLIEFLAWSGWRIGEARSLTWRQVDFKAGVVRLEPGTTKNDDGRTFPVGALPRLQEVLRSQREYTSALEREMGCLIPYVFHRHGKPIKSVYGAWRNACKRAGVPGRLIHDLRRTAIRRFERAGVPRSVAMKLSGHKTEAVYRRYAIVSEADLAEGVRKVAALAASPL
ncbi:MAG: tyrosine-type recombinase/integrase [Candidatus Eisenbacteria bacterium]|nr:tyrosine-type recombinase/integrase [Candidatus Eisenbacteria bacterium]